LSSIAVALATAIDDNEAEEHLSCAKFLRHLMTEVILRQFAQKKKIIIESKIIIFISGLFEANL